MIIIICEFLIIVRYNLYSNHAYNNLIIGVFMAIIRVPITANVM